MKHLEDQLQKSSVRWFDLQYAHIKNLLIHVPNGGYRNAIEAAKFKQMGVRAGVPDLILLHPNGSHPFMGIELKIGKNRQSIHQKEYEHEFDSIGAKYVVVRSVDEFINVVNEYLDNV